MAVNETDDKSTGPPSIRQQQILDMAADNPDMPMEALADEIPSATTELVERVLEEYGDPADGEPELSPEEADTATEPVQEDADDELVEKSAPSLAYLSPKQREVLRAIAERPTASQREIADTLDVSGPTVSNRANSIDGFNWDDRCAFVDIVFGAEPTPNDKETSSMASNGTESEVRTDQLIERVTAIEQQLTDLTTGDTDETDTASAEIIDLELAHKVAHACLTSDAITEDEELQIMKSLLR